MADQYITSDVMNIFNVLILVTSSLQLASAECTKEQPVQRLSPWGYLLDIKPTENGNYNNGTLTLNFDPKYGGRDVVKGRIKCENVEQFEIESNDNLTQIITTTADPSDTKWVMFDLVPGALKNVEYVKLYQVCDAKKNVDFFIQRYISKKPNFNCTHGLTATFCPKGGSSCDGDCEGKVMFEEQTSLLYAHLTISEACDEIFIQNTLIDLNDLPMANNRKVVTVDFRGAELQEFSIQLKQCDIMAMNIYNFPDLETQPMKLGETAEYISPSTSRWLFIAVKYSSEEKCILNVTVNNSCQQYTLPVSNDGNMVYRLHGNNARKVSVTVTNECMVKEINLWRKKVDTTTPPVPTTPPQPTTQPPPTTPPVSTTSSSPEKWINIKFRLTNKEWREALADPKLQAYKEMYNLVLGPIHKVIADLLDVNETANEHIYFTNGSVCVEFTATASCPALQCEPNDTLLIGLLEEHCEPNNLTVDTNPEASSIDVGKDHATKDKITPTTTTTTTTEAATTATTTTTEAATTATTTTVASTATTAAKDPTTSTTTMQQTTEGAEKLTIPIEFRVTNMDWKEDMATPGSQEHSALTELFLEPVTEAMESLFPNGFEMHSPDSPFNFTRGSIVVRYSISVANGTTNVSSSDILSKIGETLSKYDIEVDVPSDETGLIIGMFIRSCIKNKEPQPQQQDQELEQQHGVTPQFLDPYSQKLHWRDGSSLPSPTLPVPRVEGSFSHYRPSIQSRGGSTSTSSSENRPREYRLAGIPRPQVKYNNYSRSGSNGDTASADDLYIMNQQDASRDVQSWPLDGPLPRHLEIRPSFDRTSDYEDTVMYNDVRRGQRHPSVYRQNSRDSNLSRRREHDLETIASENAGVDVDFNDDALAYFPGSQEKGLFGRLAQSVSRRTRLSRSEDNLDRGIHRQRPSYLK
ncbi:hypothetical protein CAPTEDRAFT_226149 [Capitella teleta]|uniref:SEA domain-containing protein n=1 Tax=Capitella teleta TaxID=283909 RepID=R7V0F0_CAPTE|nr:hypothetical protein CAPTEDRAFT_226149 [Capitella teleta]|eukprot:ELU09682.1 hypothetical protein CAPTEDRAFT_226149 [Capitella teleta]